MLFVFINLFSFIPRNNQLLPLSTNFSPPIINFYPNCSVIFIHLLFLHQTESTAASYSFAIEYHRHRVKGCY